jgi:cytochrome P450
MKLPLNAVRRFRRAQAQFDEIVLAMIRERIRSGEDRGDLLSTLLAAQQGEGGTEDVARQVRDECVNLILAGHETVSNALTYTVLLLARHPEVAKRVREEIAQVAGGGPPAARHFEKLVFTRAVLAESMRLFPPAWALARTITSDYSIRGYRIKKGAIVFTSQYVMHRDPRFFPEPLEFRPERFLAPSHPRFAYFPFGAGPRQCIGEGFAWMEGVLVLATLMRAWNFEPQFEGDPPLYPSVTLRPLHAVPVRLAKAG